MDLNSGIASGFHAINLFISVSILLMSSTTHRPEYQDFLEISKTAGLIPVYRTIIADLDTPLTLLAKISDDESHIFLFESMEGEKNGGGIHLLDLIHF